LPETETLSPNADKQEMKSYLLGTVDTDHKTQFEERILSEPNTYDELLIVEEELIDQYVAGGLSKLEREQFETHFLITAERQKNLRFGQLLRRYVNSQNDFSAAAPHVSQTAPAKKSPMFAPSPAGSRPLLAFCVAGVMLVGTVLFGWIALRRFPTRSVQHNAEPVVVVTLAPGSITTGSNTTKQVSVPPRGVNLKLELELKNASFRNYKFELFRENKSVQARGDLGVEAKGQQYVVPLTITSEVLSPGDYQVKLSGVSESGADEFIQNYSFRVIE
jgi:hypothetical protein